MIDTDLRLADLDYPLSEHSIATTPAQPRDHARMMVVDRANDEVIHAQVKDLPKWLHPNDQLVLNETKVAPARVILKRESDGKLFEGLLAEHRGAEAWLLLAKNSRKFRAGDMLRLQAEDGTQGAALICREKDPEGWLVEFPKSENPQQALETCGRTPLPPYILRARGEKPMPDAFDRERYRTTFGKDASFHSVAAPTAGLHFTPELLQRVEQVTQRAPVFLTLEVGMGTFKPVEAKKLSDHPMHSERFSVSSQAMERIQSTRPKGRIVSIGTTTVRALESLPDPLSAGDFQGETKLFIKPGYAFRHVDALLTNFHLPRSTLLSLVGALVGLERLKSLYAQAQKMEYRFYSYGDAMLIL
ncbi:MAG: tRNA preQ1(34) S-adenosylmethionine ribosyltransferase-isomerase QueA [Planctomycetes bacterium]|nr:tRNA preQ1(34) S-adenosylmethionine ribosyltransferase-isomerase QueA [Planctomycetota bacterium]